MKGRFVECSAANCFATAVVTTFFAPTRTLSLCNAGHPPPLIWRRTTREWSFLDGASPTGLHTSVSEVDETGASRPGNIPLGIVDLDDFDQFDVALDVGDLVLVYTDSLMEAKAPDGEMLGLTGLLDVVSKSCDPINPQSLIPNLLKAIDEQTQGGLRADDVTALLLRANGAATRAHWVNSFTAPFKILATVARFLAGRGPIALPDPRLPNVGGSLFPSLSRRWRGRRKA
jgi:serine phosphatase RsbU (regulator of sigma subunit)